MANEYLQLIDKVNSAIRSERVMRIALSSVLAIHKPRIFEKGLTAQDSKIGTYGTKPISIAFDKMARKVGSPKTIVTNRQFNTPKVRETKSAYFKGGYAEYKKEVGKNPGFVILRNTDQMMMDYGLIINGNNYGMGFQNKFNYDKSQWMEAKYNKDIFDHDENELKVLADVLTNEVTKAL